MIFFNKGSKSKKKNLGRGEEVGEDGWGGGLVLLNSFN